MSHRISLTRVVAINWYGFNQIFDVDDMTLISGAFGTGKSALLDLIQQVMLGDGWKANQAASGQKSRGRDLVGYCLCDTNHENNGERHFLRRSGVTIIALEFTKPIQPGKDVERETWGMRIEYSNPSAQAKRTYFCVPDRLEYDDLTVGDSLLDEDRFRTKLRRDYNKDALFSRQQDYLEEMATARHLYFDRQSFRLTFPKAIAFEPETNIETFIREFILEASPLNVTEVRQSLQAYEEVRKRLEEQEHEAGFLIKIRAHNATYESASKEAATLEHIQCRLKVAEQEEIRERQDAKVKFLEAQNRGDLEKQTELKERLESLDKQLSQAAASLHGDPEAEKLKQLKDKIEHDGKRLRGLKEARLTVGQFLQARQRGWIDWLALARSLRIEGLEQALEKAAPEVDQLLASGELAGLKRIEVLSDHFQEIFGLADGQLREIEGQEKSCKRRLSEIEKDLKRIENQQTPGQFPLFERLQRELGDQVVQLGRRVEVREEADAWWPVLESLLDAERSTILSADRKTYEQVLEILSAEAPSPHEAVFDPGAVDDAKKSESPDSVMSKFEVVDAQAKARLQNRFGDVVCCISIAALNALSAPRGVSIDGYYKDGAVRRRLKVDGGVLTLGTRGLQRMKDHLLREQSEKQTEFERLSLRIRDIRNWLLSGQKQGLKSMRKPENTEGIHGISELEKTVGTDQETFKLLETPERLERVEKHRCLGEERDGVNRSLSLLDDRLVKFHSEVAPPREAKERATNRIEGLVVTREESRIELSKRFTGILDVALKEFQAQWIAKAGTWSDRYEALLHELQEIKARGVACRSKRDSERRSLQEVSNENGRRRHPHYQDFNLEDEDNTAWDQRLELLETVELVKSRSQAESRRIEWQQRLQDQVLNELTRRMTDAEEVIRSLRRSLNQPIGSYRYEIRQRRDTASYGNIWRLLETDFEGSDPLAAIMQESEIQSAMDELMAAVNAGADAKDKASRLLDYRNYHHYDIEKIPVGEGADGQQMTKGISLGRRGGNLSGGESQVPFFISMLAAFRRVYSHGERRTRQLDHLGLVVMDEAFSKLSSDGIADCLALARSFDLQLILAFPPEKLGVMVEHAQTVIVVQKEVAHDAEGLPTMIENTPIRMVLDDAIEALD
jgi:hypothetical protein